VADIARLPGPPTDTDEWQLHAACRGMDSDTFFHPPDERNKARADRIAAAKTICRHCPAIKACREHALSVREPYGIWVACPKRNEPNALACIPCAIRHASPTAQPSRAIATTDISRSPTHHSSTNKQQGDHHARTAIPDQTLKAWRKAAPLGAAGFARATMPIPFSPEWLTEHPEEYELLLAQRLIAPTPPEAWRAQFAACAGYLSKGAPKGAG
jgi:WhiB family redox-sensing transcriptional regulator